MRKNRFLLLFAFALFVFLPFTVDAATVKNNDEFIDALGGSEYAKLTDGKIILEKDVELDDNILIENGNYILDLNGKTIFDTESVDTYVIRLENSSLTINDSKGSGEIDSVKGNRTLWVEAKSTLTINGGSIFGYNSIISYKESVIEINGGYFEGEASAFVCYGGDVTINDGTFTTKTEDSSLYLAGSDESGEVLTINGGNFEGPLPFYHSVGDFVINGGKFKGNEYSIYLNLRHLSRSNIYEGEFDKGIGLYQARGFSEPIITVDNGLIFDLLPSFIGGNSTVKPDGYINRVPDYEGILEEDKFKTADNLIVKAGRVNIDANNGKFSDGTNKMTLIFKDIYELPEPTRDGYIFKGWYTKTIGGKYIYTNGQFSDGITFYAHWDKEGTSTIDLVNQEEGSLMSERDEYYLMYLINKGEVVIETKDNIAEIKNKEGKLLFTIDADNEKIIFADGLTSDDNIVYELTEKEKDELRKDGANDIPNKIEVIVSSIKKVIVTFDANGGIFKNDIKTMNIEDIINFNYDTFEKPTRNGYKFIGFYTNDGKSYLEVMNSETGIEEDTTFYAKWEENSEVTPSIPDEENPKTFDGIGSSIFMGTISLIGLAGATIYLRKKNKVRV